MTEAVVAGLAAVLVWAFYRIIETNFPESYFAPSSPTDPIVNRSLLRYALWRLGPVFVGASAVVVTIDRLGKAPVLAAVLFLLAHLALSVGMAAASARRRGQALPLSQKVLYLTTSLAAAASTAAAYFLAEQLGPTIPEPPALLQAVWLGVFAAVIGTLVSKVLSSERPPDLLAKRSLSELPNDLLAASERIAIAHGTDPRLVKAVMITENLQRPPWLRRLERSWIGRVSGVKTSGVMQVAGPGPYSDIESIEIAVSRFMQGLQLGGHKNEGVISRDAYGPAEALRAYNADDTWVQFVQDILRVLAPAEGVRTKAEGSASSTGFASDDEPVISITSLEFRSNHRLGLVGSYAASGVTTDFRQVDRDGNQVGPALTFNASRTRQLFDQEMILQPTAAAVIAEQHIDTGESLVPHCRMPIPNEWHALSEPALPPTHGSS